MPHFSSPKCLPLETFPDCSGLATPPPPSLLALGGLSLNPHLTRKGLSSTRLTPQVMRNPLPPKKSPWLDGGPENSDVRLVLGFPVRTGLSPEEGPSALLVVGPALVSRRGKGLLPGRGSAELNPVSSRGTATSKDPQGTFAHVLPSLLPWNAAHSL